MLLYIRIKDKQDNQKDKGQSPEQDAQAVRESKKAHLEAPGKETLNKEEPERKAPALGLQESSAAIRTEEQFICRMESYSLSGRELEVAWLLFRGYTNRQIAEELFIAETTVKKHVTHIYEKMQITGRKEFKKKVKYPEE